MNHKLGLLVQAGRKLIKTRAPSARSYFTDHLYPYPHNYVGSKIHPRQAQYRETWPEVPWYNRDKRTARVVFVGFWTYWWFMLFKNPEAILGHEKIPDPREWSDEELGIPPDNVGLYEDWIEAQMAKSESS